jgi:hypothetical protein
LWVKTRQSGLLFLYPLKLVLIFKKHCTKPTAACPSSTREQKRCRSKVVQAAWTAASLSFTKSCNRKHHGLKMRPAQQCSRSTGGTCWLQLLATKGSHCKIESLFGTMLVLLKIQQVSTQLVPFHVSSPTARSIGNMVD